MQIFLCVRVLNECERVRLETLVLFRLVECVPMLIAFKWVFSAPMYTFPERILIFLETGQKYSFEYSSAKCKLIWVSRMCLVYVLYFGSPMTRIMTFYSEFIKTDDIFHANYYTKQSIMNSNLWIIFCIKFSVAIKDRDQMRQI